MKKIETNLIDIHQRKIYPAAIHIESGFIKSIERIKESQKTYICPGLIDAHIHIESSMLVPYEFARIALCHGTVATVSDPHEIANVLGVDGVQYMIDNAKHALLKFHFGAPSCVPATSYETAGAVIDSEQVTELLASDDIYYLSEMMNYPGVLNGDHEVMAKITAAHKIGKPVDGHAPGLMGQDAASYIHAGISTDHECYTIEEALGKLAYGMKILIREGSAAKNYEALHPLIADHADRLMFCSDDKHPDDLLVGHLDILIRRSLALGYDLFDLLRIASLHPVEHYHMNVGLLRVGDPADFIMIDDPASFRVLKTYINGIQVADTERSILKPQTHRVVNHFNCAEIVVDELSLEGETYDTPIIEAIDGALITEKNIATGPSIYDGIISSNVKEDILKIAVVNRYQQAPPAIGFIKNFGLSAGAIASTVAHDSHNIISVGVGDESMTRAINILVQSQGGLSAVYGGDMRHIALPIAGLMSDLPCQDIGVAYADLSAFVQSMGCLLRSPYMTLSFMALLVIPNIKISDKGMFDAENFSFY